MNNCIKTEQSLKLPVLHPAFQPTHYFFAFVCLANYFVQLKKISNNVPTKRNSSKIIQRVTMYIKISVFSYFQKMYTMNKGIK